MSSTISGGNALASHSDGLEKASISPNPSQMTAEPLPATIRVRITGQARCDTSLPYTVRTLSFYDYLRHVLPNEWIYTWDRESLRAGAVAVKMYAWYWVLHGGKWPDADVYDSACDQVYNPNITFPSTDQALQDTWNWKLTRDGEIFQAAYLRVCRSPHCLDQSQSQRLARNGYTWDEILDYYYPDSELSLIQSPEHGFALRFLNPTRSGLLIPLTDNGGSLGVNIGDGDFTLEWWLKAKPTDNHTKAICNSRSDFQEGVVLFDRSVSSNGAGYGIAIFNSTLAVSITGQQGDRFTLCGMNPIANGRWHHLAVQRNAESGQLWLFVDGHLDASGNGPSGDISYPPVILSETPGDRFLAVGISKTRTTPSQQTFLGWIDEIRFSNILRNPPAGFAPPEGFYEADEYTTALFHLDEGYGRNIQDASRWDSQASNGFLSDPASLVGTDWFASDLFTKYQIFLPRVTMGK